MGGDIVADKLPEVGGDGEFLCWAPAGFNAFNFVGWKK